MDLARVAGPILSRMKLGTLRAGGRDGTLVVVRRDGLVCTPATMIAPTLQAALDDWQRAAPALTELAARLDHGDHAGLAVTLDAFAAPLPRAYEWIDGSAFPEHARRVRQARGAEVPATLLTEPTVYQGGSGVLLAATDAIAHLPGDLGLDFEGEICAILGDTPMGTAAHQAERHVLLLGLANDVTLRNLVPGELGKGFGFLQSKPATAFSPFVVTPDELGPAWRDGRAHLPLSVTWNGAEVGRCDGGEMHFSFFDLVAHVTRTRRLTAGTIVGSGTVANADPTRGVSCLAERRALEMIEHGAPRTRFLLPGDRVRISMADADGRDLFGAIDQSVVAT